MSIDERIETILVNVFDAGVMEERQQLDFHTNLYTIKQDARKAIKQLITEARIDELENMLPLNKWVNGDEAKYTVNIDNRIATLKEQSK